MERTTRSWLTVAATTALLSACAAGPAPVDHFYSLESGAPSSHVARPLAGTLQVDRPRTSAMIGERHVLYREQDGSAEIAQHGYHRWSDSPPIMVQSELVAYLKAAGAAENVMAATARVKADYVVAGRIRHFERVLVPQPRAVVEIDLSLTDADGNILVNGTYRAEEPAEGATVADSATAFGAAVHEVMDRFLADFP